MAATSLLPHFLTAMGDFRHELEELSKAPAPSRKQQIVTQIMSNMLEEAYIKIARATGTPLADDFPGVRSEVESKAAVIDLSGAQLKAILTAMITHGSPEAYITLVDDGSSFQVLLSLEDGIRVKKIYEAESFQNF